MKKYFLVFVMGLFFTTNIVHADYTYIRLLNYGKRGGDVKELQLCLNRLGYHTGTVDGIFGWNTERGVRLFQKSRGLFGDAIIGRKTGPQFVSACSSKNEIKLLPHKNGEIYFSAFPDFGGSEDKVSKSRIRDFEELAGKKITWATFSQNWYDGISFPKKEIDEIRSSGSIPVIRLMARTNEDRHGENGTRIEKQFSLKNIVNGKFDEELKKYAQEVRLDGKPLLFDFDVEANGNWFLWSGIYNGAGETKKYGNKKYPDGPERWRDAYRHIIDIFKQDGVRNVTWFFHVDINSIPNKWWNQAKYYYPGDEYIDWIGVSLYGAQNDGEEYWDLFSDILSERYQSILDISNNKPFALMEFGVTDNSNYGDKSEWLEDAFKTILNKKYIPFSAINYWHEDWKQEDGSNASLRIDSSSRVQKTFQKFLKDKRFISKALFSSSLKKSSLQKNREHKNTANIIFKSGFEKNIHLLNPIADDGGIWWQKIIGSDVDGFSWPISIHGEDGEFQLIVDENKDIKKYIRNTIETVKDKNGNDTRALHQIISRKQYEHTQDPYIIYTGAGDVENLYIKYSMKLPDNIAALLGKDGWMALTEYKTTGDYRLAFYIYEDDNCELYWYVHGDNVVGDPDDYKEFWYRENYDVNVPVGEWFDMEVFWHRSKKKDGRVWWAINGDPIVDYHGKTKIKDPIDPIMVFTNYASRPIRQWIDNIVIADNFPCGVGKSCIK